MSEFSSVVKRFPKTFWVANVMELFERWAYYGMFGVLSIYLTSPIADGGLGFSQEQRGVMQGVVTAIMYLLPIFGGAIADHFGFRKVLLAAFSILTVAYYFMGQFTSYPAVFAMFLLVAVGAAIFKPVIVGTVAKTTNKASAAIGFGLFYMMVNIGGFLGPFIASKLRDISWDYVFIMASVVIAINLIPTIFIYKEPGREEKDAKKKQSFGESMKEITANTATVLKDTKFMIFLLIMVGFWTMFIQIFITLPVFIQQWVDTTVIYDSAHWIAAVFGVVEDGKGIIRPEMILNLDAGAIIIFQMVVSYLVMKVKPLNSIISGIIIAAIGVGLTGFFMNGWYIIVALLVFAVGEMASSPRSQEYIGMIAPPDKVGLYMGYSFLPVAGGNLLGGILSGSFYGAWADKYTLIKQALVDKNLAVLSDLSSLEPAQLEQKAMQLLKLSEHELTLHLWNTYNPGKVWFVFTAIGMVTVVALFFYDRFLIKSAK